MDATNPTLLAPATNAAIAADLEVKRPTNLLQTKNWLRSLPPLQLLSASQKLADELAVLHGYGLHPSNGCFHAECFLGDADVTVEYEHTGASGDGWNEPREEESIAPICAWINGVWVDADKFDADVLNRWHEAGWERLRALAEAAEEDRAAALHADRMARCESASRTPGPWKAGHRTVSAPETDERLGLDVRLYGGSRDDNKANARLIAAAPDMLDALEAILPWIPSTTAAEGGAARHSENVRAADMVRAAIAKAKGTQS